MVEKTVEERAQISVEVVNLLADKNCTIEDAKEILTAADWTIQRISMVRKLEHREKTDCNEN